MGEGEGSTAHSSCQWLTSTGTYPYFNKWEGTKGLIFALLYYQVKQVLHYIDFFSYIYFQNLWMGNLHGVFAYSVSNAVKGIQANSCRKNKLTEALPYWRTLCMLKIRQRKTQALSTETLWNIFLTKWKKNLFFSSELNGLLHPGPNCESTH